MAAPRTSHGSPQKETIAPPIPRFGFGRAHIAPPRSPTSPIDKAIGKVESPVYRWDVHEELEPSSFLDRQDEEDEEEAELPSTTELPELDCVAINELRARCASLENESFMVREQLLQAEEEHNERYRALEEQCEAYSQESADLRSQVAALADREEVERMRYVRALEDLKLEHARELEALKLEHAREVEALKEDVAEARAVAEASLAKQCAPRETSATQTDGDLAQPAATELNSCKDSPRSEPSISERMEVEQLAAPAARHSVRASNAAASETSKQTSSLTRSSPPESVTAPAPSRKPGRQPLQQRVQVLAAPQDHSSQLQPAESDPLGATVEVDPLGEELLSHSTQVHQLSPDQDRRRAGGSDATAGERMGPPTEDLTAASPAACLETGGSVQSCIENSSWPWHLAIEAARDDGDTISEASLQLSASSCYEMPSPLWTGASLRGDLMAEADGQSGMAFFEKMCPISPPRSTTREPEPELSHREEIVDDELFPSPQFVEDLNQRHKDESRRLAFEACKLKAIAAIRASQDRNEEVAGAARGSVAHGQKSRTCKGSSGADRLVPVTTWAGVGGTLSTLSTDESDSDVEAEQLEDLPTKVSESRSLNSPPKHSVIDAVVSNASRDEAPTVIPASQETAPQEVEDEVISAAPPDEASLAEPDEHDAEEEEEEEEPSQEEPSLEEQEEHLAAGSLQFEAEAEISTAEPSPDQEETGDRASVGEVKDIPTSASLGAQSLPADIQKSESEEEAVPKSGFEAGLSDLYRQGFLRLDARCPCGSGQDFGQCHYQTMRARRRRVPQRVQLSATTPAAAAQPQAPRLAWRLEWGQMGLRTGAPGPGAPAAQPQAVVQLPAQQLPAQQLPAQQAVFTPQQWTVQASPRTQPQPAASAEASDAKQPALSSELKRDWSLEQEKAAVQQIPTPQQKSAATLAAEPQATESHRPNLVWMQPSEEGSVPSSARPSASAAVVSASASASDSTSREVSDAGTPRRQSSGHSTASSAIGTTALGRSSTNILQGASLSWSPALAQPDRRYVTRATTGGAASGSDSSRGAGILNTGSVRAPVGASQVSGVGETAVATPSRQTSAPGSMPYSSQPHSHAWHGSSLTGPAAPPPCVVTATPWHGTATPPSYASTSATVVSGCASQGPPLRWMTAPITATAVTR